MPIDYSSQSYWESRLAKERETGYEWLVPTSLILPIISEHGITTSHCTQILHFGCGSSFLGHELQSAFGRKVKVTDADYAATGLRPNIVGPHDCSRSPEEVPLLDLDVLSLPSVVAASPAEGWDLLVDKSTADAISCGPPCGQSKGSPSDDAEQEAIEVLCRNLAQVTRPAGRWVSISYSSERFDFLSARHDLPWRVTHKLPVRLISPTTVRSKDIVYQPEAGVWAWVLERVESSSQDS
jgi:hypothetical protein